MPKLSVYVQDDLWDRAKSVNAQATTSQLVQEALTLFVEARSHGPAYMSDNPSGTQGTMDSLKSLYEQQARRRFEEGYRKGLEFLQVGGVPWDAVEELAEVGFDVRRWIAPWYGGWEGTANAGRLRRPVPPWLATLSGKNYLGQHANPKGGEGFNPDRTYVLGFKRALKDVWRAVEYGSETDQRVVGPGTPVP